MATPSALTTNKIKKNMVLNYNVQEQFDQALYDTVNYPAAGTGSLSFFANPVGTTVTLIRAGATGSFAKTKRDTNLTTNGMVSGQLYFVDALSLAYRHEDEGEALNPADRDKIRMGSWIEFKIGSKLIFEMPTYMIPELNPILAASTTVTATSVVASVGGGGQASRFKFANAIPIPPNQSFTLTMNFDGTVATTKAVDVAVILHAQQRRPS